MLLSNLNLVADHSEVFAVCPADQTNADKLLSVQTGQTFYIFITTFSTAYLQNRY